MKKEVISIIAVIVVLIICMIGITYMYKIEPSSNYKPISTSVIDTIPTEPEFYNKSPKEGLYEALKFYDIKYPEIVYAQAILETGHFKSRRCVEDNNLFGLYNSKAKQYYVFNHWSESIIAYKNWVQYKYKDNEDYYNFLDRIHYAEDSLYNTKLKQIVSKNYDKRRITTRDSTPKRI